MLSLQGARIGHRSGKDFGSALGIDAAPERGRPERVGCGKGSDARRHGGDGKWKFLRNVCLSFVSVRVCGRERGNYVGENGLVSRSIEGWRKPSLSLYLRLSLSLASLVS